MSKFLSFFKIDYDKLRKSRVSRYLILDLFMILLVLFNLTWIIYDYSFRFEIVQSLTERINPSFYSMYKERVYPNFILYDLIFVAIFLLELSIRWIIAIVQKTYEKWFFYPFVHWYDVLGCIPLSSFRFLRFFRVFSMFYRLQRLGIIDVTSTYLYKKFTKYTGVVVEEISDRVVVNVLSGVQDEINKGTPVVDRIITEVIRPKQDILVKWMSEHINDATTQVFMHNQAELKEYVENLVARAVKENKEISRLKYIPGVGNLAAAAIEHSISDISFNVITESVKDMATSKENKAVIEMTNAVLNAFVTASKKGSLDELVTGIADESIEVVKDQVLIKQWKLKEIEEKESKKNS